MTKFILKSVMILENPQGFIKMFRNISHYEKNSLLVQSTWEEEILC